jgi:hypothetical protein
MLLSANHHKISTGAWPAPSDFCTYLTFVLFFDLLLLSTYDLLLKPILPSISLHATSHIPMFLYFLRLLKYYVTLLAS